ncbi:hypothetical protein B0H12DRAFT_317301 [Mycena haematopus]|nr:hypothetical protein B0H12DRAFT_317301 [Mycena haematopus]
MLDSAPPPSVTTVKEEPAVVKVELEPEPESKPDADTDLDTDAELDELDTDSELATDPAVDRALDAELDARYGVEFPHVKPGGHVPRPRNAFICFRSVYVGRHKEKVESSSPASNLASTSESDLALDRLVGLSESTSAPSSGTRCVNQTTLSSDAARTWNALSHAQRAPLLRMALREKQKHARAYPGYRYAPGAGTGRVVARKPKPNPRPASKLKLKAPGTPKSLRKSMPAPRRRASTSTSTPRSSDPDLDDFFQDATYIEQARRWRAYDSKAKKRKHTDRAKRKNPPDEDQEDLESRPTTIPPASRSKSSLRKISKARKGGSESTRPRRVSWASPVAKVEQLAVDVYAEHMLVGVSSDEEEEKPQMEVDTDLVPKLEVKTEIETEPTFSADADAASAPAFGGVDILPGEQDAEEKYQLNENKITRTLLRPSLYDLSLRQFGFPAAASPIGFRSPVHSPPAADDSMDVDSEESFLRDNVRAAAAFCESLCARSRSPAVTDSTQTQPTDAPTDAEFHAGAKLSSSTTPSPATSSAPPPAHRADSTKFVFEWDPWLYNPLEDPDELGSEDEEQRFAAPVEDFGFFYPFDLDGECGPMKELDRSAMLS